MSITIQYSYLTDLISAYFKCCPPEDNKQAMDSDKDKPGTYEPEETSEKDADENRGKPPKT